METVTRSTKRHTLYNEPNTVLVTKTAPGSRSMRTTMGSGMMTQTRVRQAYAASPLVSGAVAHASKESVKSVVQTRDHEKTQMNALNNKLAELMMKQRMTEATNKDLMDEVERLRAMKGLNFDRVRMMFEDELQELKEKLDASGKELAKAKAECISLDDKHETECLKTDALRKDVDGLQDKLRNYAQENGALQGELAQVKNLLDAAEMEIESLKAKLANSQEDNIRLRGDEQAAIANQLAAQEESTECRNSLDLLEATTSEEINELIEMMKKLKSNVPEKQTLWKNEFKTLITDIKSEYDRNLADRCEEFKSYYDEQLIMIQKNCQRDGVDSEIAKTQTKTLKSQMGNHKSRISDLERDLAALQSKYDSLKREYDEESEDCENEKGSLRRDLGQAKQDLDEIMADVEELRGDNISMYSEIACYKRLLECEEGSMQHVMEKSGGPVQSRGGAKLQTIITGSGGSSGGGSSGGGSSQQQSSMTSESTGSIKYSRLSKSSVSIGDCAHDGTFIEVKNSSPSKDLNLNNWVLTRTHPKGKSTYKFDNFTLAKGKTVKIYAYVAEEMAGSDEYALAASKETCKIWGSGNGKVCLTDAAGKEEKCSLAISFS